MLVKKVIIIDQQRNSVEVEMDINLYRTLGIRGENIMQHRKRTDLNRTVTKFLNKM